jgi:hypothetical protein
MHSEERKTETDQTETNPPKKPKAHNARHTKVVYTHPAYPTPRPLHM